MSLSTPVRYDVKKYSHIDVAAPKISSSDGSIKNILKACLVTGYGDKVPAGWVSVFEDSSRIVLRPEVTLDSPPYIKVENGVVGGVDKHRIIAQDNPSGVDDTAQLSSINMPSKSITLGSEWYLIATSLAFIFCYKGDGAGSADASTVIYVGDLRRLRGSQTTTFVITKPEGVSEKGAGDGYSYQFFKSPVINAKNNNSVGSFNMLSISTPEEIGFSEYLAQMLIVGNIGVPPFFAALSDTTDTATRDITIDSRPMLRFVPRGYSTSQPRIAMYIPLDYWEF